MSSDEHRLQILAIHRYFWPDAPPYASILRAIASHWADQGHDVEVLASQPSYKVDVDLGRSPTVESLDGIHVRRLDMRSDGKGRLRKLWNVMRFSLLASMRVLIGRRRDVVMCSTAPQVVLAWLVSLAAKVRGAKFVYHCMDLHPEIGALSGEFAHPLAYKILMRLDTASCRRAHAIVVLSVDMRDALLRRDSRLASRVVIINNFDLPQYEPSKEAFVSSSAEAWGDSLVIAFTGNLGRFQSLEAIVEAVLGDDPRLDHIRLVLMGDGGIRAELVSKVDAAPPERRKRIEFHPHSSPQTARALMRTAHLGLVCLMPGVISFAYPSKTATYLSEGLPILAAVEPDSALARDIHRWGVGGILPTGSPSAVRTALLDWVDRRNELEELRIRSQRVWRREFSFESKIVDWDRLLPQTAASASVDP